jgi:hypothetical protein
MTKFPNFSKLLNWGRQRSIFGATGKKSLMVTGRLSVKIPVLFPNPGRTCGIHQRNRMDADQNIDRSLLHFSEEVKDCFSFLEGFGFSGVHVEPTLVRYESREMVLNIYHGRKSYEIGLEIESSRMPTESYSFSEILRLIDIEKGKSYDNFATHTAEGVTKGVQRLAVLLRECINAGIFNDEQLFSRLKRQRDDWSRKYEIEVKLQQAQIGAESAWAKKDFGKVVAILSPLQDHLKLSDLKKLEYAKNHLKK